MTVNILHLTEKDVPWLEAINAMFGEAFDDKGHYSSNKPSSSYLKRLLATPTFIALAAVDGKKVVGAIVAYELQKCEQQRSEIYIYDLAVVSTRRKEGIATALIEQLKVIAVERGACGIFVQADKDEEDKPAIGLYSKLGVAKDVFHFDIPVQGEKRNAE